MGRHIKWENRLVPSNYVRKLNPVVSQSFQSFLTLKAFGLWTENLKFHWFTEIVCTDICEKD